MYIYLYLVNILLIIYTDQRALKLLFNDFLNSITNIFCKTYLYKLTIMPWFSLSIKLIICLKKIIRLKTHRSSIKAGILRVLI